MTAVASPALLAAHRAWGLVEAGILDTLGQHRVPEEVCQQLLHACSRVAWTHTGSGQAPDQAPGEGRSAKDCMVPLGAGNACQQNPAPYPVDQAI